MKLESVAETKLLDFNVQKSSTIVLDPKAGYKTIMNQLVETPLFLCNKPVNVVQLEKYLGDYISTEGLAHSIQATIEKRKPKALQSIFEIKSVVEDCRSNVVGGLIAGLDIWELAIIPFILNNSETWTEIGKQSIEILDNLQLTFLRSLLRTPKTCPIGSILLDTGSILIFHRISQRKLMFYHHLINLPNHSLAYQIAKIQENLGYPGLIRECTGLLKQYSLESPHKLSKYQWKNGVKSAILRKNKDNILKRLEKSKKIDSLKFKIKLLE